MDLSKDIFSVKQKEWKVNGTTESKIIIDEDILRTFRFRIVKILPNKTYETHEHNFLQLLYFHSGGDGVVFLDDLSHEIEKDLVIVVRPGICHSVRNNSSRPICLFVLDEIEDSNRNQVPFIDY